MHTTNNTTSTAMADLDFDLDELQALCDAVKRPWYGTCQIADGVTDEAAVAFIEAFSPDTVSELIAAARRAAQPVATVRNPPSVTQNLLRWALGELLGALPERRDWLNPDAEKILRAVHEAKPATPSPQVAEGEELPPLPEPDGSASVPVDESRATFTEVDAWSEELVRQAQRDAIAASRRAAGGEALVSPDEWAALCRFRECCDDFDSGGHDVDKAMMRRLERIGVVRSTGFGRHEMTDFGNWLHDHKEAPAPASAGQAAPAPLVAKLTALRNEAEAERQSETDTSRKHICEGMSLAFGAAAILAAQPAKGAAAPAGDVGNVFIKKSGTLIITAENMIVNGFTFWFDGPARTLGDVERSVKAWANEMIDKHSSAVHATHQPSAQDGGEA